MPKRQWSWNCKTLKRSCGKDKANYSESAPHCQVCDTEGNKTFQVDSERQEKGLLASNFNMLEHGQSLQIKLALFSLWLRRVG